MAVAKYVIINQIKSTSLFNVHVSNDTSSTSINRTITDKKANKQGSSKFYLPKVSLGKFAKVLLHQIFVLSVYGTLKIVSYIASYVYS